MEVITRKTELLGTISIYECDKILVYNTATFQNISILEKLDLGENDIRELISPSSRNIVKIYEILTGLGDLYIPLSNPSMAENTKSFKFNNFRSSLIGGEGFNVIIALRGEEILGYIQLLNPCGYYKRNAGVGFDIERNYSVRDITIILNSSDNVADVKDDLEITIVTSIPQDGELNIMGDRDYEYSPASKLLKRNYANGVYDINLGSILLSDIPKNVVTDTTILGMGWGKKLSIIKDIEIENDKRVQIGFFKGDLVMFVWGSDMNYSILSLTRSKGEVFNNPDLNGVPYPHIQGNIPEYTGSHGYNHTIKYFSGRYVVVNVSGRGERIYNVVTRSWLNVGYFLLDPFDIKENLVLLKNNSWINYRSGVNAIPDLSNAYYDDIINNQVVKRFGDWFVLYNNIDGTYTYTNMKKSITISEVDPEPLIVNNQIIVTKKGDKYFLHDSNKIREFTVESAIDILAPFRRNIIPEDGIDSLVYSIMGLIFYRKGNKINYL